MTNEENVSNETTENNAPELSVEQTIETTETAIEPSEEIGETMPPAIEPEEIETTQVGDELTQETLDLAISLAAENGKNWHKITQEERWEFIKQARTIK